MAKQKTSMDELPIFALSKIYQRHTVIFNASKQWSTLEPDGEMLEEQLFENCQIHLAYMGKDQYATLHRKPFIEQAAPPMLKSMLDLMKIQHTNNRSYQKEPMDLSLQTTRAEDVSLDMDNSGNDNDISQKSVESEPAQDLLGDNNDITNGNSVPVMPQTQTTGTSEHDKYKKVLDAICKTWSEVKLLQMKSSVVDFYLNKNKHPKGDNTVLDPPSLPIQFSRSGRPIRKTISTSITGLDVSDSDSDYESDFIKSPNRKRNHSKPHASEISDGDSDVTFDGFDPSDIKPKPKKGKGSLNTVQYGLLRRKWICTYKCQEKNCDYTGQSLHDLNLHHIDNHGDIQCTGCDKFFKTCSSMKRHAYCHGELPFVCDVCKEGFAFKSELKFHKTIHRMVHSFHCIAKDCGKSYKSSNELNKHAQKHLGVSWDYSECDYSTDDRRNLKAHWKKHLKVSSHKCIPCNKSFHFYMQLKRHRAKPECQGKASK